MRKIYRRPIFFGYLLCCLITFQTVGQDHQDHEDHEDCSEDCLCEFGVQYMTVRYDGPSGETIQVFATREQKDLVTEFEEVSSGDQLFVDKSDFLHGSVKTKTYFRVKEIPDSEVTFHTSCSEDILNQTKGYFTVLAYQDAFGHSCSVSLDLSADITNNQCFGDSLGAISLTVSGGLPPYVYEWSDGATTEDRSNLIAGDYSVSIQDASGNSVDSTFSISGPPVLELSSEQTILTCGQDTGGQISVEATGGTSPYVYSWSTGDSSQTVSGLSSGSYTLEVTDNNGCMILETYEIGEINDLSVVIQENECLNGSLRAAVSGGASPYTYMWSGGSTDDEISVSEPGAYSVIVTDINGCQATDSLTVDAIAFVEATPSYVLPTCYDGTDGAIELTVEGSHGPFSYLWSTGDTTQNLTDVGGGAYDLTITDSRGETCSESFSFELTAPSEPQIYATVNQISCTGNVDGAIIIDSLSGTGPFDISWDSGDTTLTRSELAAGEYVLTVVDSLGCSVTKTFSIEEPATLQVTLDYDFCLDTDLQATVSGGTSPYTFTWNGVPGTDAITPDNAGTYTVEVVDANGCEATSSIEVSEPFQPLNISGTITQLDCSDSLSGAIELKVTGGEEPYEYLWSDGSTSASLDSIGSGYYEVTVSDQKGCEKSRLFYVRPQTTLTISSSIAHPTCDGGDGSISLSVSGGESPYTFDWSSGEVTSSVSGLHAGSYEVGVYDAGGCFGSEVFELVAPDSCETTQDTITSDGCCDGKVTWLTLEYLGSQESNIQVMQRNDKKVVFEGLVSSGEAFTFWGEDRTGTLGPEIIVKTDQSGIRIHTSCSEPIGPGLIAGDFRVVAGASRNGGELCPVSEDAQSDDNHDECHLSYEVYPNPSYQGKLNLRIYQKDRIDQKGETEEIAVRIYDFMGRLRGQQWVKADAQGVINLGALTSGLSKGQYFLKINGGQSDSIERLIIK